MRATTLRARQEKFSTYHFSFVIFHRRQHEELKVGSLNGGFKFEVQLHMQSERLWYFSH